MVTLERIDDRNIAEDHAILKVFAQQVAALGSHRRRNHWILGAVYERGPDDIATAVEMLLSHKALVLQTPDVVAAALERFRTRPALGFTDCLLLEIARKAGHLPLGTFDRGLGKLDGAHKL